MQQQLCLVVSHPSVSFIFPFFLMHATQITRKTKKVRNKRRLVSISKMSGDFTGISPFDLFDKSFPFNYNYSLTSITSQITITSSAAMVASATLGPLGLPEMVSHLIAGLIMGPSGLGRIKLFREQIFPGTGYEKLGTLARFGLLLQYFLVGIQVSPAMISKAGRKAKIIGLSSVVIPLLIIIPFSTTLAATGDLDCSNLTNLGFLEAMSSFPVIACYLTRLNILNSELSRVAFSSSMVGGAICFVLLQFFLMVKDDGYQDYIANFEQIFFTGLVLVLIFYVLKPAIRKTIKLMSESKQLKETQVTIMFLGLLLICCLSASWAEMQFAAFIFGLIVPSGPPLGSVLVKKIDFFVTWISMPLYYSKNALEVDLVHLFDPEAEMVMVLPYILPVLLLCFIGKFLAAFLPALFYSMSYKDAILLGLTMNVQGFVEISLFRIALESELITAADYTVMYMWILIMTGILTPFVRYLHKSSMEYKIQNVRSIQQSESENELRILACIYEQVNVPSIIHLLKATNPTKENRITASVVHFLELTGVATPVTVSHKGRRKLNAVTASSQPIINVLRMYEEKTQGCAAVHPYTVVSPYAGMHEDVCMLALQKRTSLIILPFHKDMVSGEMNVGIRIVNCNVLDKAPCSVGIVIDRGILGGLKFALANWASYRVAVVFIGGVDDREALAHGARMAENPTVHVTVVRFFVRNDNRNNRRERRLDDEMISDFMLKTAYNERVYYVEEVLEDGAGIVKELQSLGYNFELILLGRRHDRSSPVIIELTEFNKCSELGTVGDVFIKLDYEGKATIFILQQHTQKITTDDPIYDDKAFDVSLRYDC